MMALTSAIENVELVDTICLDMEVIFSDMYRFEEHVRITRKEFISRICNCLEKHSVEQIPSDSLLYKKLYLLYVKCVRTHISFKLARNQERFTSIVDMENQFNELKVNSSAITTLLHSKKSKRFSPIYSYV